MSKSSYDLIVIGGGPGGYVGAIRAAQLGLKTALVEKTHLGGVCLNWGCIPTKALLRSAEIFHHLHELESYGLAADNVRFDLDKIVKRSRNVAQQLSQGVKHLLKKNKIEVFEGHGKIKLGQNKQVVVEGKAEPLVLSCENIMIATGARPRVLPGLEPDGKLIWTSREAMIPETIPQSLLVIGSGAIGIEFATFYNAFGAKVTVVEMQNRILPQEDEEISSTAMKIFERKGITIHCNATVASINKNPSSVEASLKTSKGTISEVYDKIIVAAGIVGNTENLGLEGTKVVVNKGHIETTTAGQTAEPGVYAIGDVTGAPWLAHKASHEAIACVEAIAGHPAHPLNIKNIPGCTYSLPQIASVGFTEKQALDKGYIVKVGRFPFLANGKAAALGEKDGLIKTVLDAKTGELLGAHMIGAEVTELIQGFGIARTLEATEAELMATIFPHPTLSEMMHESVLDAYDRVIHF